MKEISFFDLEWHDAVFKNFSVENISTEEVSVKIIGDIYIGNDDLLRVNIEVAFENVLRLNILCDFDELNLNKTAGNFNTSLYLEKSYTFMLFGGYIEIFSKKEPKCILLEG